MFGTELETAYFTPPQQANSIPENIPQIINQHQQDTVLNDNNNNNNNKPSFDQITPPIFQQNDNMIKELQYELEKQRNINKKDTEPLYDRYVSKKKDVMKLLNIALTVLLAISLHFVLSDLIKSFLHNNDFTNNKETFIKFMYPTSVLLILWSFKVFNK